MPISVVVMCSYILDDDDDDEEGGHLSFLLQLASCGNGGRVFVFDRAGAGPGSFDGFYNVERLLVCDFAEDDMLAIKPAGDDGGDEELGSIAGRKRDEVQYM